MKVGAAIKKNTWYYTFAEKKIRRQQKELLVTLMVSKTSFAVFYVCTITFISPHASFETK